MKNVQKILSSTLALALVATSATLPTHANTFSDVSRSDWYYSYVSDMANQGFVSGTTASTFNPMEKLTLSAFATMIANGFYGDTLTVKKQEVSGDWWTPFLSSCASRNGLVGTVAESESRWQSVANTDITRYDMATMIYNLLMEQGVAKLTSSEISTIIQQLNDKIDAAYQEAVATVVHYGFMTGKGTVGFDGWSTSNRAEASVVLSALVNSPMIAVERVGTTPSTTPNTGTLISQEEAKNIALAHAGVSASEVTFVKVELDWDDGIQEYEVEFYVGYNEYDYEINALTGAILSYDREMETPRPSTTPNTGTLISQEEAKNIALAHAGVSASEATFVKVELDWDDGIQEYEVEFYVGYNEYDYEINALTGAILSYDRDMETPLPSTTPNTGTLISQEEAKNIALAHAGVSASEVTFVKVELDWDDGIQEYEVEFDLGYWEYEYEINATTGAIISFDRDD